MKMLKLHQLTTKPTAMTDRQDRQNEDDDCVFTVAAIQTDRNDHKCAFTVTNSSDDGELPMLTNG